MAVERRFLTNYREADTDEPGLVLDETGAVWKVAPGGSRTEVGASDGGLPSPPTDWIRGKRVFPQIITPSAGYAFALVVVDQIDEQSGVNIGWDAGTPDTFTLEPGWYSVCLTAFFIPDAADADFYGTMGVLLNTSDWTSEIPAVGAFAPPASLNTGGPITLTAPDVRIPLSDTLQIGIQGFNATQDFDIRCEFVIVRKSGLT